MLTPRKNLIRFYCITFILFFFLDSFCIAQPDYPSIEYQRPIIKRHIALSLQQLQNCLENSINIEPETPLPITTIQGITFLETGEILLLGIEEEGDGITNICSDDIILAMRSMWNTGSSPGMSIDPRPDRSLSGIGPVQDVVYFGGIENTRIGIYAFNCDYWMKRLAAGKIPSPLPGFERYCDLILNDSATKTGNRFWFYPRKNEILISPKSDIMMFENNGVQILTEIKHFSFNKNRYHTFYKNIDPVAERFAEQLTNRYDELSAVYPDLSRLRNFFALCGIFKWLEVAAVDPGIISLKELKYLLYKYEPVYEHTTPVVNTVETSFNQGNYLVKIVGGVSCEIKIPENPAVDKSGRLITFVKNILTERPQPSALFWEYRRQRKTNRRKKNILKENFKESRTASRRLKNGFIVDLYVTKDNNPTLNIFKGGKTLEKENDVAEEFKSLLDETSTTRGKLGQNLIDRWNNFYNEHLSAYATASRWNTHDGQEVVLKPLFVIKSNEVSYRYANLERIPVLSEKFIIFTTGKNLNSRNSISASARDIVTKINNIPKINNENVVVAIKTPQLGPEMQREWETAISELRDVIGENHILYDPTKTEFKNMLKDRRKEIMVFEFTHTNNGIELKNNDIYNSKDIIEGTDLSHIKYLVSGLGSCNLFRLERGKFANALREKGLGIIHGSYRYVPSDIALKRLKRLIHVLKHIKEYDLPPYHIIDIIDQLENITGRGTTNLGKVIKPEKIYSDTEMNVVGN